jgi:hypothetical protein
MAITRDTTMAARTSNSTTRATRTKTTISQLYCCNESGLAGADGQEPSTWASRCVFFGRELTSSARTASRCSVRPRRRNGARVVPGRLLALRLSGKQISCQPLHIARRPGPVDPVPFASQLQTRRELSESFQLQSTNACTSGDAPPPTSNQAVARGNRGTFEHPQRQRAGLDPLGQGVRALSPHPQLVLASLVRGSGIWLPGHRLLGVLAIGGAGLDWRRSCSRYSRPVSATMIRSKTVSAIRPALGLRAMRYSW